MATPQDLHELRVEFETPTLIHGRTPLQVGIKFLKLWTDVIEAIATEKKPGQDGETEVFLEQVTAGSVNGLLKVSPSRQKAAGRLMGALNRQSIEALPAAAWPLLDKLGEEMERQRGTCRMSIGGNQWAALSRKIERPQALVLRGETTYYGELLDVGGKNANIHIQVDGAPSITVAVTRDQAKAIAPLLYQRVMVTVEGEWNEQLRAWQELSLLSFEPHGLVAPEVGLRAYADRFGDDWADGGGLEWLRELRQEGDDQES